MRGLVVIVAAVLTCAGARAAEFKRLAPVDVGGLTTAFIELTGKIEPGDTDRLSRLLREEDYGTVLSLDSNGGDFQAGIALAKFLNQHWISTVVTGDHNCYSACAIAFLGGTALGEESSEWPARSVDRTAMVAFHAPYLEVSDGQYDNQRVMRAYDRAVRTIVQTVQAARYMNVKAADIAKLMVPQRDELVYLDTTDLLGRYSIVPREITMPDRFTRTMAVSLCANGWNWADNEKLDLTEPGTDIFQLALKTMEETDWSLKIASFRSSSPYGEDTRSILIPMGPGGEAAHSYCVVDQILGEMGKRIECRGFIRYDSLKEAVEVAREWNETDVPCEIPMIVDPLAGGDSLTNNAWALVPPGTSLREIGKVLASLASSERALPAP